MCEQRENLIAYLYDEADANERRAVEKHLESCDTCREELRAFRDVRQDLLAWDVPAHESVWKPFVTARTQPVWRQVPAWAMAVAATLVFAIGVAGGYAGRVLASRGQQPAQLAAAQTPAPPVNVTPAATREDLSALETRLGLLERTANARPVSAPAVSNTSMSDAAVLARAEQLVRESEGRMNQKWSQRILSIASDLNRQQMRDKADLQQQIAAAQEATNGSILAVKNLRTEKEKE